MKVASGHDCFRIARDGDGTVSTWRRGCESKERMPTSEELMTGAIIIDVMVHLLDRGGSTGKISIATVH